jgi:hypothetical protein
MHRLLIRLGFTVIAVIALMYGCGDSSDSPVDAAFDQSILRAQRECGEDIFLTALSPVLATWEDSIETWQNRGDILTSTPVFTGGTSVNDHLDDLADVLAQWETVLNDSLVSAGVDTVAAFDPGTADTQDYLTGLSAMLTSWQSDIDAAHGSAFLPTPPVFAADETAPVIECPGDTLISCAPDSNGVTLPFDILVTDDCDLEPNVVIDGPDDNLFPVGETEVTVTATDSSGNESSCTFTVTVEAAAAPVITELEAEPNVLWPPNHKWVTVRLDAELENPCELPVDWDIVEVTSNEAANGTGDGDTSPDWMITGDRRLKLRAERSGNGSGREYTIVVRATTDSGEDERTVRVFVPHDRGRGR